MSKGRKKKRKEHLFIRIVFSSLLYSFSTRSDMWMHGSAGPRTSILSPGGVPRCQENFLLGIFSQFTLMPSLYGYTYFCMIYKYPCSTSLCVCIGVDLLKTVYLSRILTCMNIVGFPHNIFVHIIYSDIEWFPGTKPKIHSSILKHANHIFSRKHSHLTLQDISNSAF